MSAYNDAIDKLRDEMAEKANDAYVSYVGEELTKHLTAHPAEAEKILNNGKTIAGSLEALKKYAGNHKTGNMAVIPPDEGMRIVIEYFGITSAEHVEKSKSAGACGFGGLDLDELLG